MGMIILPAFFLLLLISIGLCVLSARLVVMITKSRLLGRMASLLVFCAIFGHDIYTAVQFHCLCRDAGIHVYRPSPTKGFFYDHHGETFSREYAKFFLDYGYAYIEARGITPEEYRERLRIRAKKSEVPLYRFALDADGNVTEMMISKPESDIVFSSEFEEIHISHYTYEERRTVMNIRTGEILGTERKFLNHGGWLSNKFLDSMGFLGPEIMWQSCSGGGKTDTLLLSMPPIPSLEAQK